MFGRTRLFGMACAACVATAGFGALRWAAAGQGQSPPQGASSNQMLMRDKLKYAGLALEGITLEDWNKTAEAGKMLGIISRAAGWHVVGSDAYDRHAKNFQEQCADLERHAKDHNLEAASLDYMRITTTCVNCHRTVRTVRAKP